MRSFYLEQKNIDRDSITKGAADGNGSYHYSKTSSSSSLNNDDDSGNDNKKLISGSGSNNVNSMTI